MPSNKIFPNLRSFHDWATSTFGNDKKQEYEWDPYTESVMLVSAGRCPRCGTTINPCPPKRAGKLPEGWLLLDGDEATLPGDPVGTTIVGPADEIQLARDTVIAAKELYDIG